MNYNNDNDSEFSDIIEQKTQPLYERQFKLQSFNNTSDPVSANSNSKYSSISNQMDYGVINDIKDFNHSNMMPHFSGRTYGYSQTSYAQQSMNAGFQRKNDFNTGSINNLDYRKKSERRPLFNPTSNLTNKNDNYSTEFQGRYIPGKERRNELPFQQERVTSGLGLNYHENNKEGRHSLYRVMPKSIDEIRTLNKQQKSYSTPMKTGHKSEKAPVHLSELPKRKPETFTEREMSDYYATTGLNDAQTYRGEHYIPITNREMIKNDYVAPVTDNNKSKHTFNLNQQLKQTLKETTINNDYQHNVDGQEKGHTFNLFQKLKTPLKYLTASITKNKNILSGQEKGHTFNLNDPLKMTLKELLIHQKQNPIASGIEKGHTFDLNQQLKKTLKEVLIEQKQNHIISGQEKGHSFDLNQNMRQTLKETLIDNNNNYIISGQEKGHSFNLDYVPDITMKELLILANNNPIVSGQEKGHSFNLNQNLDTTLKEILVKAVNNPVLSGQEKGHSFNLKQQLRRTLKELYEETKQTRTISGNKKGSYNAQRDMTNIPTTLKEIYERQQHITGLGAGQSKQKQHTANSEKPCTFKEEIITNPQEVLYDKNDIYSVGPIMEFTEYDNLSSNKKIIKIDRDMYANKSRYGQQRSILPVHTLSENKQLPVHSHFMYHGYEHDALEINPYVNNVVHRSSVYEDLMNN